MHTILDSTTNPIKKQVSGSLPSPPVAATRPYTIVLQPTGCLDSSNSISFQKALEDSLEQAIDGVIVDLLWVESTDADGVAVLAKGIQQAGVLGKQLSFQSMDVSTRIALDEEWVRQRETIFGSWSQQFGSELERFLDSMGQN